MTAGGLAAPFFTSPEAQSPSRATTLWALVQRFTPSQGWAMFAFLVAALLIVGSSVTSADWVETPSLAAILFWGATAGLLLSKVRAPAVALHLAALVIGSVVVVWRTASLVDDPSLAGQVQEMWNRLQDWYEAATSGGISTDLLPLTLIILTTAWLLGYLSSWFIFRRSNPWVAVVLMGIALLTNLSFLPDQFASRFFLFIFLAMLLIVRMSIVQKQEEWRASSMGFSQLTGWMTLHAAVWFGVVVVILAAFLPMKVVVSKTVAEIWRAGRTPVANLENEFGRLFGAIPSRKDVSGRFFGLTLPFLGKISFGGEAVLWADTDYPSYWLSQTYSEYTPLGWIAGKSTPVKVGPDTIQPPRTDSLKRISVDQTLQLGFDTSQLFAGGSLDWVSRNAVVHTLAPKEFRIDLRDPTSDAILPEDVRSVAATLRTEVPKADSSQVESFISRIVSEDLALVEYTLGGAEQAAVEIVTLTRKDPIFPEIVAWNLEGRLSENEAYSIVSFVSIASDDDLRQASSEYPRFITDHYLQLPPTLPERVSQLAAQLTERADTALDRATAIQGHLRSSTFTYSQDIEAPPAGADGVDHFLFNTQKGYSDYFASSMVVLLRAAGVPSRMAAGYGPGEYDAELGRRVIRDSDSHGWAQVYFPDYGWIDFEPTPEWPTHERRILSGPGSDLLPARTFDEPFDEDPLDEDPEGPLGTGLRGPLTSIGIRSDSTSFIIPIGIILGAIAGLWLLLQFLWTRGLAHATPVERAYTKMSRMGTLAGIGRRPHETPFDYAMAIGAAIPSTALSADHIARSFASGRYGGPRADDHDEDELNKAWSTMRGPLVGRALSRFARLGLGGQQ